MLSACAAGTSWNCVAEHFSRLHDPRVDGDAVSASRNVSEFFDVLRKPTARSQACAGPPPFPPAPCSQLQNLATCADLRNGRTESLLGVRLVLGITSAPDKWGAMRRDGIRQTWLRYPQVGCTVVYCFIVGRRVGLKREHARQRELSRLDEEASRHNDLLFLRHTLDGDGPFVTISKLHAWFRLATEMLGLVGGRTPSGGSSDGGAGADWSALSFEDAGPMSPRHVISYGGGSIVAESTAGGPGFATGPRGAAPRAALAVRHIAKVDDDTFLNIPELLQDLDSLHCHPHLYYGMFAYAGYNSRTFLKCGFDYSKGGGRYRKYGCATDSAEGGGAAHPPFPFTSGAFMLASTPLVVRFATLPQIGEFVSRSAFGHHTDEDVAMGFWISRFHRGGLRPAVTYVEVNKRLTNLGCYRHAGLYMPPRNRSVGMHFLKTPGGMRYVWSILVDGLKHNASRCRDWTGDGRL